MSGGQGLAKTIVIVDDEPRLLETLNLLLDGPGIKIEGFTDPYRALDYLQQSGHCDLLITDQSMPELSGSELVKQVLVQHPQIPVIIMSGGYMPDDMEGQVFAMLPKPFPPLAELRELVARALSQLVKSNSEKRRRVLCVDDDPGVLEALTLMFQAQNIEVECAGSGKAGLSVAATRDFDLVLTDYKMYDLNGATLAQQLKMQKPDQDIVMMTAFYDDLAEEVAKVVGIRKVIEKPFSSAMLKELW